MLKFLSLRKRMNVKDGAIGDDLGRYELRIVLCSTDEAHVKNVQTYKRMKG